jgi:hypothetical protein
MISQIGRVSNWFACWTDLLDRNLRGESIECRGRFPIEVIGRPSLRDTRSNIVAKKESGFSAAR